MNPQKDSRVEQAYARFARDHDRQRERLLRCLQQEGMDRAHSPVLSGQLRTPPRSVFWRIIIPASIAASLLAALRLLPIWVGEREPGLQESSRAIVHTQEMAPTMGNYERLVTQSPETLDALLAQDAKHRFEPDSRVSVKDLEAEVH